MKGRSSVMRVRSPGSPFHVLLGLGLVSGLACGDSLSDPDPVHGLPPGTTSSAQDAASSSGLDSDPTATDTVGEADGSADASDGSTTDDGGEDDCVGDRKFFAKEVFEKVLLPKCEMCHNPSGAANASGFVLVGNWWGPTYLSKNLEVSQEMALRRAEGQSWLLAKPTNTVMHGGAMQLSSTSPHYEILREFVDRVENPDASMCDDDPELDLKQAFESVELIDAAATLRRAAIVLVGRLPTADEIARAEAGESALRDVLRTYTLEDGFYDWIVTQFNDDLLTDASLQGAVFLLDLAKYPNRAWYENAGLEWKEKQRVADATNTSISREGLNLMAHVLREQRPFTEILTADYTLVNPYAARSYGLDLDFVDDQDPDEYLEVRLPGVPHAGILSSVAFLNRFPSTDTNRNRARSRKVLDLFLGTDILSVSRPLTDDPGGIENPTMNDPNCSICHSILDPIAGAFQNFAHEGQHRPAQDPWHSDMRAPGFDGETIPADEQAASLAWLGRQISGDRRFAVAMVQLGYRAIFGRASLPMPNDPELDGYEVEREAHELQALTFGTMADHFIASHYDFRTVLVDLLMSPYFRAADHSELDPRERQVFADLGLSRFLGPEFLNRKIAAVTGYPWRYVVDSEDYLLSSYQFRLFYGGIDSDEISERIGEPNGVMANVVERMAFQMSCWTVPRDLSVPPEDRRLLPLVDADTVPEDPDGNVDIEGSAAIRANIRHLHERVLGERFELGAAQLESTYELFLEVWRDGRRGLANREYSEFINPFCRVSHDFWTGAELPPERVVDRDPSYAMRAWMMVVSHLLSDYRFLHE